MNNKRRSEIKTVINELNNIKNKIENIALVEEDCMDNVPENLQGGDKYSEIENNVEILNDSVENIEESISILMSIN